MSSIQFLRIGEREREREARGALPRSRRPSQRLRHLPRPAPPSFTGMGSHVELSDSALSADSVTSRAPAPPLRSVVVAPASHQLGSRGWDAGAGPSRAVPSGPAADAGQNLRPWQVRESRRSRHARRGQEQRGRPRQILPAARPPGGNSSRITAALHGCCYNCGLEGHISAQCTNDTVCVRCGGSEHTSRDCKRPRSPPVSSPPRQAPPPLWAARAHVAAAAVARPRAAATVAAD